MQPGLIGESETALVQIKKAGPSLFSPKVE